MREGAPSLTAQRVAAYRLSFERVPAPFGDPRADEQLARDLAGSGAFERSERMERYLRGRTAFFDRVVVNALEREVGQVVLIGAGYDGRALRYAKPGVRWFEVDHPSTQLDKRARLEALGIDAARVTYVALDLRDAGLAHALVENGYEPDAASMLTCEGVTAYLDRETIAALLREVRALATVGTRFAVSFSPATEDGSAVRQRFRETVAAAGEPVQSSLTAADATGLLAASRWRPVELSQRAEKLGCLVAAPVWRPSAPEEPSTRSRVGGFLERMLYRAGTDTLAEHLETTYGVEIDELRELDLGVHRVDMRDGRSWIARVFPAGRHAEQDVAVLRLLERAGFPAERLADGEAVSIHEGQPVLVTVRVPGTRATDDPRSLAALGRLLGELHNLPHDDVAVLGPGGCWHHLAGAGGPCDELSAAAELLEAAEPRVPAARLAAFRALRVELSDADAGNGLPEALTHPDFVTANAIAAPDGELVLVDWTGAGRAPRLWSLAWLLYSAGSRDVRHVETVAAAYREAVVLAAEELAALPGLIRLRPAVLEAWCFCTGRKRAEEALQDLDRARTLADAVAAASTAAFDPDRVSDGDGAPADDVGS